MNKLLVEIDDFTLDTFVNNHPKEHFMQTSKWGKIKAMQGSWGSKNLGFYVDDTLVATALLLYRSIPVIKKKIFYAPRGYVIDFNDMNLVHDFTQELVKYCKKMNACYIMLDPDIYFRAKDKDGNVLEEHPTFIKEMEKIGYHHQGFNLGFEKTQPRFTFRLNLQPTKDELFSNFSKIIRTQMKNGLEYGIECYKSDDIDLFYEILQDTAHRSDFIQNQKKYYQDIYNLFKQDNMATCYMAKYYPAKHIQFIHDKLTSLEDETKKLNKKLIESPNHKITLNRLNQIKVQHDKLHKTLSETQKHLERYPEGVVLSSGITLNTQHKAWLVYGGNRSILRDVSANYCIKQFEIFDDKDKNFEFVDFFGTCAEDFDDAHIKGIHEFKKKFGSDYIEFPGEFHYVISPFFYHLWIHLYPIALKLARKLRKK